MKKMNRMSIEHASVSLTLEQMLKLLRRDVSRILAKLDQSESLLDVEETLEDEKWFASQEEYKIFDFIRSLALIATKLQPALFEETKDSLTEFWKDIVCEDEWEDEEVDEFY